MKKIILITLIGLLSCTPSMLAANKKNKKFDKTEVVISKPVIEQPREQTVNIANPKKQLYGEWNIETVKKKELSTSQRAYIYLDFNLHRVYGSNGCNTINGTFTQNGNNISFKDIITTMETCHNHNDRSLLKTLAEVQRFQVTIKDGVERMQLLNNKGQQLITLRRQNLDILNGAWKVKEMGGNDARDKDIKMVIDVDQLTVHANTGCNIINGVVSIDPAKLFAVQFEDLNSSGYKCETIDSETEMLLALEQTEYYQRISDNEIAFKSRVNGPEETVMIITRLPLKK